MLDAELRSFLVIYSAGTPLKALQPRTVSIPASEAAAPVTSLVILLRAPAEPHPVPYLTFQFPRDIRGRRLTLRFADPAALKSLLIGDDSSGEKKGVEVNGTASPRVDSAQVAMPPAPREM
jgi:hypothetical protein